MFAKEIIANAKALDETCSRNEVVKARKNLEYIKQAVSNKDTLESINEAMRNVYKHAKRHNIKIITVFNGISEKKYYTFEQKTVDTK